MSLDAFPSRSTAIDKIEHLVRAVGGTTAITKTNGLGVAVTRTGTGAYLLTWSDAPGNFLGATAGLQATTVANLAGHSVIFGAYSATAKTLAFTVRNAADAAHDLAALEWVTLSVSFSQSSLN